MRAGIWALKLAIVVGALSGAHQAAASSYLDDYFLPTAKLALNKIQQSFGSASSSSSSSGVLASTGLSLSPRPSQAGAPNEVSIREAAKGDADDAIDAIDGKLPNGLEFVKVDTGPPTISLMSADEGSLAATSGDTSTNQAVIAEAEASTPTTTTTAEAAAASAVSVTSIPTWTSTLTSTSATTSSQPSTSTLASSPTTLASASAAPAAAETPDAVLTDVAPDSDQRGAVAASREAELEAIAAVDASIGFGDMFNSLSDTCYDEYGNAKHCEPEFENVAYEKLVEVASECGHQSTSKFCLPSPGSGQQQAQSSRQCHICDASNPKKRHPASMLTDMHLSGQPSCWVSAPLSYDLGGGSSNRSQQQPEVASRHDNVSLTLNLQKAYEISYISVQFCSQKPDSMAIYKSNDHGKSWLPYQFYSSQCERVYARPPRSALPVAEASCQNSSSSSNSARLAFSTLDSRADKSSPEVQEWLSATNIRLVLDRPALDAQLVATRLPPASADNASSPTSNSQDNSINTATGTGSGTNDDDLDSDLTRPSNSYNYAIGDVVVGARCKCNGHASRCYHNDKGKLTCDCRHNTSGRECEKCLPFHHDRPWARATIADANPCQPCNCNGHSRRCKFDAELYRMSGKRSGGVCIDCRDNTAGRHCHYCVENYTRDHSRPITDKDACKPCDCHPLGSLGKVCNQTTGQCPCKEGVTGLQCNRCAPGYQQSNSVNEPCIKLPENDINNEPSIYIDGDERPPQSADPPVATSGGSAAVPATQAPTSEEPDQAGPAADSNSLSEDREPAERQPAELAYEPDHRDYGHNPRVAPSDPMWRHQQPTGSYHTRYHHNRKPYYDPYMSSGPPQRHQPKHHRPLAPASYAPFYGDDEMDLEPADDDYAIHERYGHKRVAHPATGYRSSSSGQQQPRLNGLPVRMQDMANVDPGPSVDEPSSMMPYPSYSGLDSSYVNRIDQPSLGRMPKPSAGPPRTRGPSPSQKHPLDELSGAEQTLAPKQTQHNSLASCGDCQSATKKLYASSFCHLDYALKVNVLGKSIAQDWTRIDVDVVEIYKSPATSRSHNNNYNHIGDSNEHSTHNHHNSKIIKLNSVQSIWIPSEDNSCKCPNVKTKTSYLVLGSLDTTRNSSAPSLLLDRHGVALEWKPKYHERMAKYQRRHLRGKCVRS